MGVKNIWHSAHHYYAPAPEDFKTVYAKNMHPSNPHDSHNYNLMTVHEMGHGTPTNKEYLAVMLDGLTQYYGFSPLFGPDYYRAHLEGDGPVNYDPNKFRGRRVYASVVSEDK